MRTLLIDVDGMWKCEQLFPHLHEMIKKIKLINFSTCIQGLTLRRRLDLNKHTTMASLSTLM
jgi:hypothetical protein